MRVTVEKIENYVCGQYCIDIEDLSNKCAKRKYTEPRKIIVYLCLLYSNVRQSFLGRRYDVNRRNIQQSNNKVRHLLSAKDEWMVRFIKKVEKDLGFKDC